MKRCYKIKNLFGSYIYDTITPEEKADVEEHIKTCQKCADDLKTQQKTLETIKVTADANSDRLYLDQDRFMWNVYRRIALESMKQRSRQATLRKFVFQPAIATTAIVFLIALSLTRFGDNGSPEFDTDTIVSAIATALPEISESKALNPIDNTKESIKKESNKSKQKIVVSRSVNLQKQSAPAVVKQAKPDILLTEARISNSRDWLMNADLINYSLGEPRRALSRYQMIIDHYPDTDAAKEAQKRINTILNSEFEQRYDEVSLETGSSSGI